MRKILASTLLCTSFGALSAQVASAETSLREDLINLSSSDSTRDAALVKLKAAKRAELVVIVREMLNQSATENFAVRAATELNLNEVMPDIRALARKSTSVETVLAANLSQDQIRSKLDSFIGQKKNSALKSALISLLTEQLTTDEFEKLIRDDDYYVRESVVSQFFSALPTALSEQHSARLAMLLQLKPVQARAMAIKAFSELSDVKKRALKKAWAQIACTNEEDASVKALCLKEKKEAAR